MEGSGPLAEIYCDLNARMTDRGYSLERRGSVEDLAKLGLTLAGAVGRRVAFVQGDADEQGVFGVRSSGRPRVTPNNSSTPTPLRGAA